MSRLAERIALRLARFVAGPARSHWLDAMEAELDHLPARRLDWALGSLVAAIKDRVAREKLALAALVVLPLAAAAAVLPVTALSAFVLRTAGLPFDGLGAVLVPIPLPFAVLLGAALRWRRPAVIGALAFAAWQAGPALFLHLAWGNGMALWGPNLASYGIHPAVPIAGTLALWCVGVCAGAALRNRRARMRAKRHPNRPSP